MEICQYNKSKQEEWDGFVENHPQARFFFLSGYKQAIEETYGYKGLYFLFKKNGETIAALPCFKIKGLLSGHKLLSLPFAEYGGLLGGNLSSGDAKEITALLKQVLLDSKSSFLEVHGGLGVKPETMQSAFCYCPMYEYAVLPLGRAEDIWNKSLDRQARKAVNKARKANLTAYLETTEKAISEKFYPLYLLSMKHLGTPPHPKKLFLAYLKYLKDNLKLFLVNDNRSTIAALLGFTIRKRVHITYTASDPKYWEKRANDLAHWAFIEWACRNGYQVFDFGVVRYEGQRRFKEKWGVKLASFSYCYLFPRDRKEKKICPVNPASRQGIRLSSWLWRNCLPLRLTGLLGPFIRQRLGK